jgi:hypothetical protein
MVKQLDQLGWGICDDDRVLYNTIFLDSKPLDTIVLPQHEKESNE